MARNRKESITQEIMHRVAERLKSKTHNLTRKQYARHVRRYIRFCRERFNCHTFEECADHIQDYSDYLQAEDYTASTIHTYLAAVCAVFDQSMETIRKPIRHVSEYQKGRNPTLNQCDLKNPRWNYIVEFQQKVGIRRNELKHLQGSDFGPDESGHPCVIVRRGKGGKMQYQRILPRDVDFIRSYFSAVSPTERVFKKEFFQNDLNLHALRAQSAKEYYTHQLKCLHEDPTYATNLENEVRKRWTTMNIRKNGKAKPFRHNEFFGVYTLRGKNRAFALKNGLPVHYDKRALLATSVFKLSHWRNDVTVASYLLANTK